MKGSKAFAVVVAFLFVIIAAGCSASNKDSESSALTEKVDMIAAEKSATLALTAVDQAGEPASPSASVQPKQAGLTTAADPSAGIERKLVYKANLNLVVKNYAEAQNQIRSAITGAGGYVLSFKEENHDEVWSGHFTAKVPSKGLNDLLGSLDKIPSVSKNRSVEGTDFTEEFVDLNARLKVKEATEARLMEFLQKATKTDDLVKFVNQLDQVQAEIEQMKGRMTFINQNVALSTVEIDLAEKKAAVAIKEDRQALGARISGTFADSVSALGVIFRGLLLLAVGATPFLIILAVIAVPVVIISKRRKQAKQRTDRQDSN
ncbi:DUF4349 domain-containing protein [Gorillibacterium sp. sgz500922]|uniref:DUF4349 domain-containing protein n=1 Tax=Gorillibacterium sp. sgz500922 TaxID=3446694 RepID=UPI003F674164